MSYIVPVHRPSGVRLALKLNLIEDGNESIVVAKANRLEIYSFDLQNGLRLESSRSIYGYITMLQAVRPRTSATDHLFVATDRHQYFTCSWDHGSASLKTEQTYVDQSEKTLRDTKQNDRVHIDPTGRYMTIEMYDGITTVVPIVQAGTKRLRRDTSTRQEVPGSLADPIPVRVAELSIRASTFLDADPSSVDPPQFAVLWEDHEQRPQLKIQELLVEQTSDTPMADLKQLHELRHTDAMLDEAASHLIPVPQPYGGLLVLGERSISYFKSDLAGYQPQSLDSDGRATVWSCWTRVDDLRWLLADEYGHLYFLMLDFPNNANTGKWQLDKLDAGSRTSKASCLVYLDGGLVFVGSHSGDSQLVQIVERGVEIIQTFSNIAPILDLQLMELGRGAEAAAHTGEFSTGQARLVTCSGAWEDGSIRTVRTGVGMEEIATIGSLDLITDMWGLKSTSSSQYQDLLLFSSVTSTRILKFDENGAVEELESLGNVESDQPTLLASNLPDNRLLQIHALGLQVSDIESGMHLSEWRPATDEDKLTGACATDSNVVVVEGGRTVHLFDVKDQYNSPVRSRTFDPDSQISSVAIPQNQTDVCFVTFWQSASIAVLDLRSLDTLSSHSLGSPGVDIPRSSLVAQIFENAMPTLLVSMADGTIISYGFDASKRTLISANRTLLGSEPVFLKVLPRTLHNGTSIENVFASCEQPSLIYGSDNRLMYSAINSEQAARVCPLHLQAFPGAIAVASLQELKLAMIDTSKTTQIQTLPIGSTVRALAYQPESKMFAMAAIERTLMQEEDPPREELDCTVKLVDEVTFKEIDSLSLRQDELVECIIPLNESVDEELDDDEKSYKFVVGISLSTTIEPREVGPRGRIIVLSTTRRSRRLEKVAELQTKGPCRCLASADGVVVAGLSKVVAMYSLVASHDRTRKLKFDMRNLASIRVATAPLSLDIIPGEMPGQLTIAVGDIMKSLTIITATGPDEDTPDWTLEETARHWQTVWTMAVAATETHESKEWAVADAEGNILTLLHDPTAYKELAKRLQPSGAFRIGEIVNKITPIRPKLQQQPMPTESTSKGKGRSGSTNLQLTRTTSTALSGSAALVRPKAFMATVEGSIYLLGSINKEYINALLSLQTVLTPKLEALGGMPWAHYRAFKSETKQDDEPYRFIDGEVLEQAFLRESDEMLEAAIRDSELGNGYTVELLRTWGQELRRLY